MELVIFYLIACAVVAVVAQSRGRFALGWGCLAVLISPLLALVLVLALKAPRETRGVAPGAGAFHGQGQDLGQGEVRRPCPDCAELVLVQARKCRYCGSAITPLRGAGTGSGSGAGSGEGAGSGAGALPGPGRRAAPPPEEDW